MSLYVYELAPWERKQEYYHVIGLGEEAREQTKLLGQQTKTMMESQLSSTNSIIASQDRIAEGIDSLTESLATGLSTGFDRVEQGIFGLKSTFEWGIAEVCWQIEQNRSVLKNILEVLQAPLDTQAKERRKRAEEAFSYGWIDDAEEEFLESEKLNRYDFTIHISLGIIYLFHKIDKEKALEYFDKAIKYAEPKSDYYTSYALLHKALIKFDLGNIREAEVCSSQAADLSPDFSEASYQNAQYKAQVKDIDGCIRRLDQAIRLDKFYMVKASNDPLFDPIREHINKFFHQKRDERVSHCNRKITEMLSYMRNIVDIANKEEIDASDLERYSRTKKMEMDDLLNRNSYLDSIAAIKKLRNILAVTNKYKKKYMAHIEKKLGHFNSELEKETAKLSNQYWRAKQREEEGVEGDKKLLTVTSTIIGAVTFFILANKAFVFLDHSYSNWRKIHGFSFFGSFFLGFVIPVGTWLLTFIGGTSLSRLFGKSLAGKTSKEEELRFPTSEAEQNLNDKTNYLSDVLRDFERISTPSV
jgi:tetratricopeptide (TPR) repeat protein